MSIRFNLGTFVSIGADTGDAEGNIQRFRGLLGKDLDDLSAEFSDWSDKVFGELTTVQGALMAVTAAAGASVLVVGGLLVEAAHKYDEYVGEIAHASKITGIGVEDMSVLATAAEATGTSFDSLTHGLTFFETAVVKANAGSQQQADAFQRLGITQDQLAAGEKNIMPLLGEVMDKFHGLASGTERAAMARALFSRGGAEMLGFLTQGSEFLKRMADEAERLGLKLGADDVLAYYQHMAAANELKETLEGLSVMIGREVLPYLTTFLAMILAFPEAVRRTKEELTTGAEAVHEYSGAMAGATIILGDFLSKLVPEHLRAATGIYTEAVKGMANAPGGIVDNWKKATDEIVEHIQRLAKTLQAADEANKHALNPPGGDEGAKKTIDWIDMQSAGLKILMDAWKKAREEQVEWGKLAGQGEELGFKIDQDALKQQATQAAGALQTVMAMAWDGIDFKADEALRRELLSLQEHLGRIVEANETAEEKLAQQYQNDVAKYSAAEEARPRPRSRAPAKSWRCTSSSRPSARPCFRSTEPICSSSKTPAAGRASSAPSSASCSRAMSRS